jgi:GNAT superfamily N-acetyltransferase
MAQATDRDTVLVDRIGARPTDVDPIRVSVRVLGLDDREAMQRLLGRCGSLRWATAVETIIGSVDWRPATAATATLGAFDGRDQRLIALGGIVDDPEVDRGARLGLVVDPGYRGQRVGTVLLPALVRAASGLGYRSLRGRTHEGNVAMRRLAGRAGFAVERVGGDEPLMLSRVLVAAVGRAAQAPRESAIVA